MSTTILKIRPALRISSRAEILLANALVAVALAYFAVMACRKIGLPGLYYDEMLYVNPALGGGVSKRILGHPAMVTPYVGALKAYLYFPIFKLFGVSAETIRLPAIVISLLTLGVTFRLARLTFRPSYSALLVLLMAIDPIFIFMSKADYGPIVLMMFLKMVALYLFFLFIRTSSPRYLWGCAAACALGVYDKLNFIWFVIALIVAAAVAFRSELRAIVRQHRTRAVWPAAALFLVLGAGVLASLPQFLNSEPADLGPLKHIRYVFRLYATTMDSRNEWFLARPTVATAANWVTVPIIGLVIVAGASRLFRTRRSFTPALGDRVIVFYLLIFVLIFVQILATLAAENPNHVLMLYPFHYMIFIAVANRLSGMYAVGSRSEGASEAPPSLGVPSRPAAGAWFVPRSLVTLAVLSVATLLVASQVNAGVRFQKAIDRQELNVWWTPAIYDLSSYLNQRDVDEVLSATWGIHNQVFALSRRADRRKYVDLWQQFTDLDKPSQGRSLAKRFFFGKRVLVVASITQRNGAKGATVARRHFLSFARYYFGGSRLERVITDAHREPVFGVYYIDGRSR